jgi:hypothetical protein
MEFAVGPVGLQPTFQGSSGELSVTALLYVNDITNDA